MRDLGETLDGAIKDDGYLSTQPLSVPATGGDASLIAVSNVSTCGSKTTTSVVALITRSSPNMPGMPAATGNIGSGEISPAGESLVLVDSAASTADSVFSNDSSYDQVSPVDIDEISNDSTPAAKNSFKHKVRRSWDWLSDSDSGSGAAS